MSRNVIMDAGITGPQIVGVCIVDHAGHVLLDTLVNTSAPIPPDATETLKRVASQKYPSGDQVLTSKTLLWGNIWQMLATGKIKFNDAKTMHALLNRSPVAGDESAVDDER